MKRFLIRTSKIACPILIILVSVNYFGDAARIFDPEYEREMSEILMSGRFITNINNYDERVFQKEVINRMAKAPEVLVLGSSRTMLINSSYFPGQTFFNNSVTGASIEDLISLFQVYKEKKISLQKYYLGLTLGYLMKIMGNQDGSRLNISTINTRIAQKPI